MNDRLRELIAKSKADVEAMSPEDRAAMFRAQRRSWIKGNLMLDNLDMTEEQAEAIISKAMEV